MKESALDILRLFRESVVNVPAYKKFLSRARIKADSLKDWKKIPIVDKKGYILKNNIRDLLPNGNFPSVVYASSGSSGKPTFWFRDEEQEKISAKIHEYIVRNIFGITPATPTLVIVSFFMGMWVAGNYTASSFRELAKKGYQFSIITPGTEHQDTLLILKSLAPQFSAVILAGYPTSLTYILREARKARIKMPRRFKILTAGDKFSESWRTEIAELAGIRDASHSIIGIYGSADAGIIAHETPLTIRLRKASLKNSDAGWYFYHPKHVFLEEKNGEIILTASTAIPLIRYNMHDSGEIISSKNIVIVSGRTDVAVTFYSSYIYPEQLTKTFTDHTLRRFFSGNYCVYRLISRRTGEDGLHFTLELKDNIAPYRISRDISEHIARCLAAVNNEYQKVLAAMGHRAIPRMEFVRTFSNYRLPKGASGILSIRGKKPRVISSN